MRDGAKFGAGTKVLRPAQVRSASTEWIAVHGAYYRPTASLDVCPFATGQDRILESFDEVLWMKNEPNQALPATPVGAGLEVLSHESGVPELGRSANHN